MQLFLLSLRPLQTKSETLQRSKPPFSKAGRALGMDAPHAMLTHHLDGRVGAEKRQAAPWCSLHPPVSLPGVTRGAQAVRADGQAPASTSQQGRPRASDFTVQSLVSDPKLCFMRVIWMT